MTVFGRFACPECGAHGRRLPEYEDGDEDGHKYRCPDHGLFQIRGENESVG